MDYWGDLTLKERLEKYRCLSRNHLKLIAMVSMIVDHCGIVFTTKDSLAYVITRLVIGRIAFPLFAVLFIDGFVRTKRPWRHILDLSIFAVLSEPGYDRVLCNTWFSWKQQNVMLSWLISFLMMMALRYLYEMYKHKTLDQSSWFFGSATVIIVGAVVGDLAKVDYVWCGPLAIGIGLMVYYYKPSLFLVSIVVSVCLAASYLTPGMLLIIPIVYCYDSNISCKRSKMLKYAGYAFYPIHLTILGFIMDLIKKIPPM